MQWRVLFTPRVGLQRHLSTADYFNGRAIVFNGDLSFNQIDSRTAEGVIGQALRKMDGIKKMPLSIEKSTEFHQVAMLGLHKFLADKIPYNADYFSFMQMELPQIYF